MATVPGIPVVAGVEYSAFWRWKVRRVQWRMNVGWWLESVLPLVFLGCVLMTALVLAGRRAGLVRADAAHRGRSRGLRSRCGLAGARIAAVHFLCGGAGETGGHAGTSTIG